MSDDATIAAQDEARRLAMAELFSYVRPDALAAAMRAYLRAEQAGVDGAHLRLAARQASQSPPRAGFRAPNGPR